MSGSAAHGSTKQRESLGADGTQSFGTATLSLAPITCTAVTPHFLNRALKRRGDAVWGSSKREVSWAIIYNDRDEGKVVVVVWVSSCHLLY